MLAKDPLFGEDTGIDQDDLSALKKEVLMPQYNRPEIDLSMRMALALELLTPIPERRWGRATELARRYDVSREFLYEQRDRVLQAAANALAPQQPGPRPQAQEIVIDSDFLRRAVTVLALLKGTVRDIQQGLSLLFRVQRSVGHISQTLQEVGATAANDNESLLVPLPVLGEADEIFQGRRPCLTVVDGRSFLVLHLSPEEARDGTTWGVTLLDMQARGIQFQDLASDGATGIRAGVREARMMVPLRPDLFHLLREAARLGRRLERAAYRAIEVAERVRRAEREAQEIKRRRGPRLKVAVTRVEAEAKEQQGIACYDLFAWLIAEVRQGLEPLNPAGCLTTAAQARATVQTAVELLREIGPKEVTALAQKLLEHLEELVAPLAWLEQSLTLWRAGLDTATASFIGWAYLHRQALALDTKKDFPPALQPAVQAFWETMALFHRSSSLAESLHSWLRPYLQIHRGMPRWLLSLLQWLWNHHPFQRGQRAGQSPIELAGAGEALTLAEALEQLLCPQLNVPTAGGRLALEAAMTERMICPELVPAVA